MKTVSAELEFDRSGPELTAYLSGELDAFTAPELSRQLSEVTRPDDTIVWLDCSAVSFCASPGISLIVRAHNEALDRGGRAVVLHPSEPVLRILEMCNLTRGLHIRTALPSASAS